MSNLLDVSDLRFLDRGPYSFTVKKGECVGLSGASGIGKSQLLRAITDLIPFSGVVRCDGAEINSLPAPQWRRKVTMLPAESFWWSDRVGDHFQGAEGENKLTEGLVALGMNAEVMAWQVSRLSTGERQRLGLLRALQNKPAVLLLDEPTSALDGRTTAMAEEFIAGYRKTNQAALVWVSHDPLQLQRVAERVLQMEMTRLTECSADEIIKQGAS